MPGLFGLIRKRANNKKANESLIRSMLNWLSHNEQYVSDTYVDDWFALGNIGLQVPGEQRFVIDVNQQISAAFSGYIYSWKNMESRLVTPTLDKSGRLIELFKKYHHELPEKIDGSFNIAVFDMASKKALICNDRFGHRQLYYYEDDELFLFSAEMKAFLAYHRFSKNLDLKAVSDFFNYGFLLGDKTFFENVKLLKGGHIISFQNHRIKHKQYWDYRFGEESKQNIDELIEEADSIYCNTIKNRIGTAKDIIIPLSGGLDSRFITGHAMRLGVQPHVFTHGQRKCLDYRIAKRVIDVLGITNYKFIKIDPLWLPDYTEKFIFLTDGMVDSSPAILLGISKQYDLPAESTVFLNGIFGTAGHFSTAFFKQQDIVDNLSYEEKLRRVRRTLTGDYINDEYYKPFQEDIKEEIRNNYLSSIEEEFSHCLNTSTLFCNQKDVFFIKNDQFRHMNQVDCNRFIWHDHFALVDDRLVDFYIKLPSWLKPSRTFLIEYFKIKFPDLAKIAYQATGVDLYHKPSMFKLKYRMYKYKIRYYLERLSRGQLILYNMNNYLHFNQWYRSHKKIRKYFEEILLDKKTINRGYYNKDYLEYLLTRQRKGGDSFYVLSSLLSFEIFNRLFIDT